MGADFSIFKKKLLFDTLILSCDKYSDLWEGHAQQFNKYYTLNNNIYFSSNYKINDYLPDTVTQLFCGEDLDWSTSFLCILTQINSTYVYIMLEDLYLKSFANIEVLAELDDLLRKEINIKHIKLTNKIPVELENNEQYFGKINKFEPYRVTLCGIWNREYLISLIKKNETPWEFEVNATIRSREDLGFFGVRTEMFSFENMVEKGKWIPSSIKWAIKNGVLININSRSKKNLIENIQSRAIDFYFNCMLRVSISKRMKIVNFIKKLCVVQI